MNRKTNVPHFTYTTLAVAISTILATSSAVGSANLVTLSESQNTILLAQTQPEEWANRANLEAFETAAYTYCDAKLLASYWGQEIMDSKIRAGGKLLKGQRQGLEEVLKQARKRAKQQQQKTKPPACRYDTDYTYDDAVLLAQYWGKPSAWEAKLKIERLLLDGQNASIQTALQRAKPASNKTTSPGKPSEDEAFSAYFSSGYTYCDAKLLASYWGVEVRESKLRLGEKLLQKKSSVVVTALTQARSQAKKQQQKTKQPACQYDTDGGYTYDDAALLAQYWGKPSAWEAKLKIERLLLDGQNASIQTALQRAKPASNKTTSPGKPSEDEAFSAYFSSGYTYCDAKLLASYWGVGVRESKLRMGEKLLQKKPSVVVTALTQARSQAKKQQQKTKQPACQYNTDGGYTYDDAALLAQYWGKPSAWEAKLKIEQLLLDGQNTSIKNALQQAKEAQTNAN